MILLPVLYRYSVILTILCSTLVLCIKAQNVETTTEYNLVMTTDNPVELNTEQSSNFVQSQRQKATTSTTSTTTESTDKQSQTTVISKPQKATEPTSVIITKTPSSSEKEESTTSAVELINAYHDPSEENKFGELSETTTTPPSEPLLSQSSTSSSSSSTTESDVSTESNTENSSHKESEDENEEEDEDEEEEENDGNHKDEKEKKNNDDEEGDEEKSEVVGSGSHDPDEVNGSGSGDAENEEDEEEEEEDEEDSDLGERLVERLRALHEKAKEMTQPRPPVTFNQSMDRINEALTVVQDNFLPSQKTMTRFATMVSDLNVDLSRECLGSLWAIANGLRDRQPWAYRFLDANGKLRDFTTMTGRMWSYGDYRECLSLKSPSLQDGFVVHGQYCTLEIQVPLPRSPPPSTSSSVKHPFLKQVQRFLRAYDAETLINENKLSHLLRLFNGTIYRMGVCLPELCVPEEVERIVANLTEPIFKLPVYLNRKCSSNVRSERINSNQAVSLFVFGMFGILVILCTSVEAYNLSFERKAKKADEKLGSLMFQQVSSNNSTKPYAFSMINSLRRLFSTQMSPLSSVQSLKFMLIVYVHFYNYYNFRSTFGLATLKQIFTTYPLEGFRDDSFGLLRTTLPFDLLALILGFELAFEWRKLKKAQSWRPLTVIRDLWVLLTITFLASVLCIHILSMLGQGPAWDLGMYWLTEPCFNWTSVLMNILHLANFNRLFKVFDPRDSLSAAPVCNPASWFISVLFQLSIVVAIILWLFSMFKSQRSKVTFFAILLSASIFLSWYPYIAFELKPEMHHLEMKDMNNILDSFAWYRTGTLSYLIYLTSGIAAGLALAEHSNVLQRGIENFLLFGVFVVFQVSIALNNSLWKLSNDETSNISIVSSLFYFGPIRALNSVGIAFFIFCFTSKRIPKLKTILECRPFIILGRLSHSYLLVQSLVIFYRIFSSVEQSTMNFTTMIQTFMIDMFAAILLSGIFFCLFESPTITILERCIEDNKKLKQSKIPNNISFNDSQNFVEQKSAASAPQIVIEDWGNSNQMQRIMKFDGEDYPAIVLQEYKGAPDSGVQSDVSQTVSEPKDPPKTIDNNNHSTATAAAAAVTSESHESEMNTSQASTKSNCDVETSRL